LNTLQLAHLLQLTDSFFPVGTFAYSDGLESAAAGGKVHDGPTLGIWIDHYFQHVFVPCDGLAFLQSAAAFEARDIERIRIIDEELTAIRPASAVRDSSKVIGKRMLATYSGIASLEMPALTHCNAPVAYAIAMSHRGIDVRSGLLAFGYGRLSGMVSASLRLISIGQQEAHRILSEALACLPAAVDQIFELRNEPLRCFTPMMDMEQMNHLHIYSRLFRS